MPILGLAAPFRRSPAGFPAPARDAAAIRDSIRTLMGVTVEEREMRPDAGSQALALLFEAADENLGTAIELDTAQLLGRYEPRIRLLSVETVSVDRDKGALVIAVSYIIIATGEVVEGERVALGGRA